VFEWFSSLIDSYGVNRTALDKEGRDKINVLNRIKLFENAERNDLIELIKHTTFQEMDAGEQIIEKGEDARSLYMIDSGEVAIRLEPNQEPITSQSNGDYFGEMALLENQDRSAYVDCTEGGRLLVLEKDGFYSLLKGQPKTAMKFLFVLSRTISRNLRETNERLRSIQDKSVQPDSDQAPSSDEG
jgi:CRP-like cAMP-binding protein